jgi:hypothetical protein
MAYVAINPAFCDRVKAKIELMKSAELKTIGDAPLPDVGTNSDFFMDNVWGEHRHLCALMPNEYKQSCHEWRIAIMVDGDETPLKLETKGKGGIYPPNFSWYSHQAVQKLDYPEVQPLLAYLKTKAEIVARWENVEHKVLGFLENCKSLNEGVKLWPDLVTYIDKDDITRLGVKREKSANQSRAMEALAALNTDELMGAAVIARLSGADV